MRPAVCSGEERGLISRTKAGNRAYGWPWDSFSPYKDYKWGFRDNIVIYDVHFLAAKLKGNFCCAGLEWRVQKYCSPFSSKTDVTKSPCLVSSIHRPSFLRAKLGERKSKIMQINGKITKGLRIGEGKKDSSFFFFAWVSPLMPRGFGFVTLYSHVLSIYCDSKAK